MKEYDLELDRVVENIKKNKARRVLIQLPDGLKLYATEIADKLKQKVDCEILIWFGSCFGCARYFPKYKAFFLGSAWNSNLISRNVFHAMDY